MARPSLEVADILNRHGEAFLARHRLSRGQLKVSGAIRACRTAALGGHVMRCGDCDHAMIAYNSCRNRHCPRCQGAAAKDWLADRQADLLPVPYYHLVFTLPAPIAAVAYQNKAELYGLLFRTAAETLATIAGDPRHLGARIGFTSVLHTWGSAMTHHPHLHIIAPGGGLSPDGSRWSACRPGFFLPVRVLSRLFRRLFLEGLAALHAAGRLTFHGDLADLTEADAFATLLAPLRRADWVVYAKRPFGGPEAVLAYLARYTHRVAIANTAQGRGFLHWRLSDAGPQPHPTLLARAGIRNPSHKPTLASCPKADLAGAFLTLFGAINLARPIDATVPLGRLVGRSRRDAGGGSGR